jgi:glutamine synthetase
MFCDIMNHDESPFEGDPRQVLKRNLDRAHERGFSFMVAPEMEFFYFADGDPSHKPAVIDTGSYFDLTTADVATVLRKRTIHMLEAMGIPVEYSFHEDAPSQHEIDLRYTDALSMADNVMTFRLVVREIAVEHGYYAIYVTWARNNRSALVRIPVTKRGKESSTRIEYRSPDPACNPYLAFSVLLAAGLKGIEQGYELKPETQANLFDLTLEQLAAEGIRPLPQSLSDSLDVMEGSELVADALGEHIFEWFLRNKRAEWAEYKAQVSQFELDRYLPQW